MLDSSDPLKTEKLGWFCQNLVSDCNVAQRWSSRLILRVLRFGSLWDHVDSLGQRVLLLSFIYYKTIIGVPLVASSSASALTLLLRTSEVPVNWITTSVPWAVSARTSACMDPFKLACLIGVKVYPKAKNHLLSKFEGSGHNGNAAYCSSESVGSANQTDWVGRIRGFLTSVRFLSNTRAFNTLSSIAAKSRCTHR